MNPVQAANQTGLNDHGVVSHFAHLTTHMTPRHQKSEDQKVGSETVQDLPLSAVVELSHIRFVDSLSARPLSFLRRTTANSGLGRTLILGGGF